MISGKAYFARCFGLASITPRQVRVRSPPPHKGSNHSKELLAQSTYSPYNRRDAEGAAKSTKCRRGGKMKKSMFIGIAVMSVLLFVTGSLATEDEDDQKRFRRMMQERGIRGLLSNYQLSFPNGGLVAQTLLFMTPEFKDSIVVKGTKGKLDTEATMKKLTAKLGAGDSKLKLAKRKTYVEHDGGASFEMEILFEDGSKVTKDFTVMPNKDPITSKSSIKWVVSDIK